MTYNFQPEKCSLLQAVLCVTRQGQPIRDRYVDPAAFTLEPSELASDNFRRLEQALRSGELTSWADLRFSGSGDDHPFIPRSAVAYGVKIPALCWRGSSVHWQRSEITGLDLEAFRSSYAIQPEPRDKVLEQFFATCQEIEREYPAQTLWVGCIKVNVATLLNLFAGASSAEQEPFQPESPPAESQFEHYISPYVAMLVRLCDKLDLSPNKRLPRREIEASVRSNWPAAFGPLSEFKLKNIITFLGDPEDERGGFYTPNRKNPQDWPRFRYRILD